MINLDLGLDLDGEGDVKVVVGEERRVEELGGRRPPRLLQVEAALGEVHALRRPVREGALHALVRLLLLIVALNDGKSIEVS